MAVRIRLTRVGTKNSPKYRIVATDGRNKRDGASLEILGTYDPETSTLVQYHADRVNYWMSVGAQPSDAVRRLTKMHAKQTVAA